MISILEYKKKTLHKHNNCLKKHIWQNLFKRSIREVEYYIINCVRENIWKNLFKRSIREVEHLIINGVT
jgi:hypothetical protein